jgi:hypothetical protein
MSRWLVTHGEQQFSAADLEELKTMAADRRLKPADLVQPPGANDWIYALELPELKAAFPRGADRDDDDYDIQRSSRIPRPVIAIVLIIITMVGVAAMWKFKGIIDGGDWDDGRAGTAQLNADVDVRSEPSAREGKVIAELDKGDVVDVELKHMNQSDGNWLLVESGSTKGWIPAASAPPNFLFDRDDREQKEALYYPEKYVGAELVAASEKMSDLNFGRGASKYVRIQKLYLKNSSAFEMVDVIVSISAVSVETGKVIDSFKIPIQKPLPANTEKLPVGGVYPPFEAPEDFRLPTERERAKTMKSKLDDIDASDIKTLNDQCMPIKELYDMPELMEQIDYQGQDTIVMLGAGEEVYGKRAPGWKHCFDVKLDGFDVEKHQLSASIHQVRANPD